jgi:hypothetical protein
MIFAICREHELQWADVAPIVDHVLAVEASRPWTGPSGLRFVLNLAGLVIGGGLMITAGFEAIGLARLTTPEAGMWELVKVVGGLILGSPKLWSQIFLGALAFAFSLGRLLVIFALMQEANGYIDR